MAYAEKRGKTWRACWQLPQRTASGRRKVGHQDGFPSKTAARRYAEDQQAALRAGTWIDPKGGQSTVEQWWTQWLPAQTLRPNSIETYTQQWRRHIAPRWAAVPLTAIRGVDIDLWIKQLYAQGLAPSTVSLIVTVLRNVLEDAVWNELIPRSPMPPKGRRRAAAGTAQRPGVVIPLSEMEQILHRLARDADRLLVVTALFTGMRWSEVAGMRWPYAALRAATHQAPASGHYLIDPHIGAVHEDVRGTRFVGPPKSGPGRIIDLPPFLVTLLIAHAARSDPRQEIVFPDRSGTFLSHSTWSRTRWRRACDGQPAAVSPTGSHVRAAVPPVHTGLVFHDLKHTHKAMMNDAGIHPAMQDYRLGHVSPGAPGVYAHPTDQMRRTLVSALEQVWQQWATPAPIPHPYEQLLLP